MNSMFRFLEVLSLGVWVGAAFFVGVLLAPGAFALLPTRELAGNVVGMALTRLHFLAYACSAIFYASTFALSGERTPQRIALTLVAIALLLTIVSQHVLTPKLADLRAQMYAQNGSIDATPKESPLRQQFGQLHGVSSALELLVLLLVAAALYMTLRQP